MNTAEETKQIRQWIGCWERAGARMEELRRMKLRLVDTRRSLMNLAEAFESCRLHHKPLPTSGFVEQQYWFRRSIK